MKMTIELKPGTVKRALILGSGLLIVGVAAVGYAVPVTYSNGSVLTAKQLNDNFTNVEQRLAALESGASASSVCPPGYAQVASITTFVSCKKGNDEIVFVGTGRSSFWIDRYEASVWSDAAGAVTQYAIAGDDYPNTFPDNGQWTTPPYAVSEAGVLPSTNLTWFQAAAACRASGKRLPSGEEWLAAGRGTTDGAGCNVSTSARRNTGLGTTCRSAAGAEDMIGNVWEWTNEWYAGLGAATGSATWPNSAQYNGDGTWNIASSSYVDSAGTIQAGIPSAALRGGAWSSGSTGGLFALALYYAPTDWFASFGFRCLLPR